MGVGLWAGGSLHLAQSNPDAFPNGIGGIPADFADRILEGHNRLVGDGGYFEDAQKVKAVLVEMLEEAGGDMLLDMFASDVLMEGDRVAGLFLETKSGTLAVSSKVVIDCTETADVADRAGAPCIALPTTPSAGACFAIAGGDYDIYRQAIKDRGERLSHHRRPVTEDHGPPRAHVVEVGVAVGIGDMSSTGVADEEGVATDGIEGADRAVDAAGNDL